jgi:hypothetical protein
MMVRRRMLVCMTFMRKRMSPMLLFQGYFAKVWDLGFLPKFSPKIL